MPELSYIIPYKNRPERLRKQSSGLTTRTSRVLAMAEANLRKRVRAYKTELRPTKQQAQELQAWCDCAARVYNMALRQRKDWYEKTGQSISAYDQMAAITRFKQLPEFAWLHIPPRRVLDEAIFNLDTAYKNFFKKAGYGFPRPKKDASHINLQGVDVRLNHTSIRVPGMGWIRLKELRYIPADGKHLKCAVSTRAGRWFISVSVEEHTHSRIPLGDPIGVDMGIKYMVALDDGTTIDNPKPLAKQQQRLKRLQRKLARQVKGSVNHEKTKARLARTHYKAACIRQDALHKASRTIIDRDPSIVVIEDLNMSGMMQNGKLARAIADVGMSELRRQIEYKADWNGTEVVVADRWFASSKTCSGCGNVKSDFKLSDREYVCTECGLEICRDQNAAINLREYGTARSAGTSPEGQKASGEERFSASARCSSVKEELTCEAA